MRNALLLFILITTTTFLGCKKDKVIKATNVSNLQAATMVATSLASNANGFVSIKDDMTIYAKALATAGKGCGVVDSFAVARQDATSSNIGYNYAMGYNYVVNCVSNVQDNLSASMIYNGSFDASDLSEINSATSTFNIAPLSGTGTTYNFNGTYQTQGSFETLDATQLSGNNTLSVNIKNLVITKSSRAIVNGTADVSVSGTVKNKNTFSYNGTLVFKGNSLATLTLEGVSYSINLITAEVIAL
jgi:hypothetical protein